jgi:hypothetical protein
MADVRDLTTLADVKGYLYAGTPSVSVPNVDDARLSSYMTAVSSWIARYCGRIKGSVNLFPAQAWVEVRNGNGAVQMRLRALPIISVTSVMIEGNALTSGQGSLVSAGFTWDDQYVKLRQGYPVGSAWSWFNRGTLNVQFDYLGGYNTPGMGVVAALPDWQAATQYAPGAQINRVADGIVYTAVSGGVSGAGAPAFPTTIGAQIADGVGVNLAIQSITESGSIVTVVTMNPHGLSPNQVVTISNVSLAGYNGQFPIQTTPNTTSFTYVAPGVGLGAGAGGSVLAPGLKWQASSVVLPLVAGAASLPDEISLACMQETALLYKQRGQVGQKSFGEGPSRIDYFTGALSDATKMLLDPHRDWAASVEGGEILPISMAA